MARKQRVTFSLSPDIVERLDEQIEKGERSATVEEALEDYLWSA
jgi:metal-responsive CopG/Arc/MetJ family transcriptional regulator